MLQGGFKSLICPPVFAKPSVLFASAAQQWGVGDTCIVFLKLPVLLLGEDLVHNFHSFFALSDIFFLLGEKGIFHQQGLQKAPRVCVCVCVRFATPLPGLAEGSGLPPITTSQQSLKFRAQRPHFGA